MNSLIETSLCSSGIDPSLRSTDSRGDTAVDISMQISVHEQHHSTRRNGSFDRRSFDQGESAHRDCDFWCADWAKTISLTRSFPFQ
jgi:hypothetical protein